MTNIIQAQWLSWGTITLLLMAMLLAPFPVYAESESSSSEEISLTSTSENQFDDGDNPSGLFSRILEVVKESFSLMVWGSMIFSIALLITYLVMLAKINENPNVSKTNILRGLMVAVALGSPVACTAMYTDTFIGNLDAYDAIDDTYLEVNADE